MAEAFRQTGGLWFGCGGFFSAASVTWPLASLEVSDTGLRLTCLGAPYGEFPRASILRLSKYKFLFSSGLRIEHNAKSEPFVVFWTFNFSRLKRELEQRGYTVA